MRKYKTESEYKGGGNKRMSCFPLEGKGQGRARSKSRRPILHAFTFKTEIGRKRFCPALTFISGRDKAVRGRLHGIHYFKEQKRDLSRRWWNSRQLKVNELSVFNYTTYHYVQKCVLYKSFRFFNWAHFNVTSSCRLFQAHNYFTSFSQNMVFIDKARIE